MIPRDVFIKLRGLDEFYSFWGVEDVDLTVRLAAAGLKIVWVEAGPAYHQWHPPLGGEVMPKGWWTAMNLHMGLHSTQLARNPRGWGRMLEPETRISINDYSGRSRVEIAIPRLVQPFTLLPSLRLPVLGAFELAYFSRRISTDLSKAAAGQTFVCRIARRSNFPFSGFLYKLLFLRRCKKIDGSRFFSPAHDVPDVLWSLLLPLDCCDDYRIIRTKTEIAFIFRKAPR